MEIQIESNQEDIHLSSQMAVFFKGVAIIMVIISHIISKCYDASYITNLFGTGGTSIFLLLSGYGLYSSYKNKGIEIKSFWESKINKIFIPYILITAIYGGGKTGAWT